MSGHKPESFEQTHLIPDAVQLYVTDQKTIYEGWEDVEITRELNTCAGDFQMALVDKWEQNKEPWRLAPGERVHMHAGGKSILTGYIDKTEASVSASDRNIKISGRSKTCDLVDCSVMAEDGNQFTGLTLKEIVNKLVKPFGVSTIFAGDAGEKFASVVVNQGETVFALLDRLARLRRLVIYPNVEGQLVFADAGIRRAATELVQGVNVLSGQVSVDHSDRFSVYRTKSQPNNLAFLGTDEPMSKQAPVGEATDPAIKRYRPLMLMQEVTGDDELVADRAGFESSLRAAKSLQVDVEVRGWFQEPGRLWDINELVHCDLGFLGIRRTMLVHRVTYSKNNSGTTAKLMLILPDALDFKVKKKKKKEGADLSWLKVLDNTTDTRPNETDKGHHE